MGFITVDELRAYPLPVTDAQWNKVTPDQIQIKIDDATQTIKDWLERDIELTSYVERVRGTNRSTLMLDNYPVVSVTGLSSVDLEGNTSTFATNLVLIDTE